MSKVISQGLSFNLHYLRSQGFRPDHSKHRYANNVNKSTLSFTYQNYLHWWTLFKRKFDRANNNLEYLIMLLDKVHVSEMEHKFQFLTVKSWTHLMVGIKYETPSCVSATALSLSLTYPTYHRTNINQFLTLEFTRLVGWSFELV